jgi:hypothetical protein
MLGVFWAFGIIIKFGTPIFSPKLKEGIYYWVPVHEWFVSFSIEQSNEESTAESKVITIKKRTKYTR